MADDKSKAKRLHRATFGRDKRKGGYLVRVEGPNSERFSGREVPVTKRDGKETVEKLGALIWMGTDEKTGAKVALYSFEQKKREGAEQIEF